MAKQKKDTKPVLSIGLIFKNEIRCLERCLKSLQPLRDAVPCEVVVADTGATDGSRAVAEKYADILIDFPWINDFAAARNAVMDRCSGQWYLSIDADEWLDEDVTEITAFFERDLCKNYDASALMERNYYSYDLTGGYGVFMPWRLLRMSTGLRYKGAIHETWDLANLRLLVLRRTLLHHDGYVEMNAADRQAKRERNMKLIRKKLEEDPDALLSRLQFIESGGREADYLDNLYKAVELVEKKVPAWDTLGASVYRYAIDTARMRKLPEIEDWIKKAETQFFSSYFIRMDAAIAITTYYLEKENFDECVRWGEIALKAYEDYWKGEGEITCQLYGSLQTSTPICEAGLKIVLSRGYFEKARHQDAVKLLEEIDYTVLDARWTQNMLETLQMFQHRSELDIAPLVSAFWEGINKPEPAEDWAERRRAIFVETGAASFTSDYQKKEENSEGFCRHVYTLYKPLAGRCPLGGAAMVLDAKTVEKMAVHLSTVENWEELPTAVLEHALQAGVVFPLPDRPMNLEEIDGLAARLSRDWDGLFIILEQSAEEDFTGSWQTLTWVRALALAAVQNCKWRTTDRGMELARIFVKVERAFIAGYYSPEVLWEENLCVLPAMHRFGWYCAQAFDALEAGDTVSYVRLLRAGLTSYEGAKPMVEFLLDHTPELQTPPPSPELLELAEKVRTMLAAYPPDDPAVAALKESPVYQRVAHLIEIP